MNVRIVVYKNKFSKMSLTNWELFELARKLSSATATKVKREMSERASKKLSNQTADIVLETYTFSGRLHWLFALAATAAPTLLPLAAIRSCCS